MDGTIHIISGRSILNGLYDPYNFWSVNPLGGRAVFGRGEGRKGGAREGRKKSTKKNEETLLEVIWKNSLFNTCFQWLDPSTPESRGYDPGSIYPSYEFLFLDAGGRLDLEAGTA